MILANILKAHHFDSEEKQLDFIRLLYLAGCFDPEKLEESMKAVGFESSEIEFSLQTVKKAVNNQFNPKDLSQFNPEEILTALFPITKLNIAFPEKHHHWLIKVTQQEFFARKPGQERWQQETGKWMITYENEVRELVARLHLEAEVSPQCLRYDAIGVYGATASQMEIALEHTKNLVEEGGLRTNYLYLLSGERYVDNSADGGEKYLSTIANKYGIMLDKVTEAHLFKEAYEKIKGKGIFANLPCTLIDTPRGNKTRPTTLDTLIKLSDELEEKIDSILFISRAPHIQAQAEDAYSVFNEKLPGVKVEVVGCGTKNAPLNRTIGALGGALYGGYIRAALQLGYQESSQELKETLKTLSFSASVPLQKKEQLKEESKKTESTWKKSMVNYGITALAATGALLFVRKICKEELPFINPIKNNYMP